ncbi:MAG: CaiB/BaiF CoA transferase family protein [Candidatus Tectimicrobiota bacterium]
MAAHDLPLGDIRVLDLSEDVAGPFCTKLLAGLGAEVLKIEPPGCGDVSRRSGPFVHQVPHPEQSAAFLYLNTGKKSLTLDISTPTGAALLQRLLADCDILVESCPVGYLEQHGLGYADLERLYPGLLYTSVTPFGQTGPYREYQGADIIAQALGGLMHPIGLPEREPLKVGGQAALYTTGMSAFAATMLALHVRDATGQGQHVDVSVLETTAVSQIHASIQHQFGRKPVRRANTLLQAQDGWIHPGLERGIREDTWARLCALMGRPELAHDPQFNSREARREHQQEVQALISAWTATQPKEELYHALQGLSSVAGYVATVADLQTSRQLLAREFFRVIEHPVAGPATYPGAPFHMEGVDWQHGRAPLLGEHNVEIYCGRLGYSHDDLAYLRGLGII